MEDLRRVKAPCRGFRWTRPSLFSVNTASSIPHRALCTSPHFVRWGEIYPIFGPRLNFFGAALTMTLIASPIPPDRRNRPVQEADIHAPCTHSESCKDPRANTEMHRTPGRQRRVTAATIRRAPRYSGGVSYWRGGHRGASLSAPMIEVQGTPK